MRFHQQTIPLVPQQWVEEMAGEPPIAVQIELATAQSALYPFWPWTVVEAKAISARRSEMEGEKALPTIMFKAIDFFFWKFQIDFK